ncbi:hypothetical protein FNO01nite_33830 [Flavobacterium noncentrifugens]|uniref:Uncharacterized protein n=1 Tax=Flavobacterium noncentrifugens TaxID=1128970 RepID=A0A1G9DKW2_9FLAO|nr:hypothetical protein [Flavobacterium noncentrifugens]GEP52711.1 hypothetical protein FNO01nite_33830 [Flavobacterium noncentrifugens]SDK64538.1 hypothetical protein SAMN04487935_3842 [Flavobacterium noncentrifugens]SDK64867.1 hypothetical protein SAMN04487935_3848 [Flavobacterium noncentrifugens]
MKKIFFLLLISNSIFSQSSEVERLSIFAERAFSVKDYNRAKTIYNKIVELDSTNVSAIYNLAISEWNLGEKELACEHLYKCYSLNDYGAAKFLQEYCKDIPEFLVVPMQEVDEKPKFIVNGEAFPLFVDDAINKKYLDLVIKQIRDSEFVYKMIRGKGKMFINFHINKKGIFDGNILRFSGAKQEEIKVIEFEMIKIFNKIKFTPALKNGKVVETSNKYLLPIDFGT